MAAPAAAAGSITDSRQESLSAESVDAAFQQVSSSDTESTDPYNADNVSVWDRSPLPLRVETSTAATQIDNPILLYSVAGEVSEANLNKPTTGVFNAGESINFDFSERTLATTSDYSTQSAQFVTARIEESPNNTSEAIDIATLQSPTAEEYTVEDVGPISSDGSLDINRSFAQSGHYLTYVVVVEEGEGLDTTADGNLTLNGSVEVVGMDAVAVQSSSATVSAPAEVQRGENITADVSSGLAADAQNHLLVAYNETQFKQHNVTFISDTNDFNNLSEDNLRIEHTLDRVNGVGSFNANVSVLGFGTNTTTTASGLVSTESIFAELTNQTSLDGIENNSTGDNVLDASANATATLDGGTLSVGTLAEWETGDYRLIYIAQEDGAVSNFSTTTDTVTLVDEPLEAGLTAEPTNPDVNETAVTFDASSTQGSVVEYQWDFDGDGTVDRTTSSATTSYVYDAFKLGDYTASVTAVNGDSEESTATTTVSVGDTVSPTAALDLTVDGTSVAGGEVDVNTRVTVTASGTTDNHRLGTPYSWEVTNSSGVVAGTETLDETTSFRLSEAGSYTVKVTVVDETGNQNSTTATVNVVDESILSATINAEDQQRLQDGLNATVNVSNVGSSDSVGGYDYTLTATGDQFSGGEITRTFTGSQSSLNISETDTLEFNDELTTWAQAQQNRTVGDVDLVFNISTDGDGQTLNDSTTVDVTYSNLEAAPNARDTIEGFDVDLRSFITNNGTAVSDDTTAMVTVDNASNTEVFNETIDVSSLGTGEILRDRNTTSFDTTGAHTLEVSVEDALFGEGNTVSTNFEVSPYKLDIQETTVPNEVESGDEFLVRLDYLTNVSEPVNASVNVSDVDGLTHIDGADLQQPSPKTGTTDTVTWRLKATEYNESDYDLEFSVESAVDNVDKSDTATRTVESARRTEVRTTSSAAIIQQDNNSASNTIRLYGDNSTISQSINVSVQAGAQGRTLKGVEYLVQYPYGCVEQTTSAFLGALSTDQYYRDRDDYNISDTQQNEINMSIEDGVKRLGANGARSQSSDGSWNMWGQSNRNGETFYSMYALYGLSEVHNDDIYGDKHSNGLNETDFDKAVTWLKTDAQRSDGSFSGSDPGYYIGDDPGATGFAMVSLTAANETAPDRISSETEGNVTSIYVNASNYLVEKQLNNETDSWANNDRSTALAVWGLTQAYDAGVYDNADFDYNKSQMKTAIEDGASYLESAQDSAEGSWSPYQQNEWWSATGDKSETTAYAVLALNETTSKVVTNNQNLVNATEKGTDFLTSTYETRGSWGYTRADSAAIKALTQVTSGNVDRTVDITFKNSSQTVSVKSGVSINVSSPTAEFELSESQLSDVRDLLGGSESGTVTVNVTDTGTGSSGAVITGVENSQEVDLDVLEADSQ